MIYIGEKRKREGRIFLGGRARVGGWGADLRRFFLEQHALESESEKKRESKKGIFLEGKDTQREIEKAGKNKEKEKRLIMILDNFLQKKRYDHYHFLRFSFYFNTLLYFLLIFWTLTC